MALDRIDARREAVREERQAQGRDAEKLVRQLAEQSTSQRPSPSKRNDFKQRLMTEFHLPESDAERLLGRYFPISETAHPDGGDLPRAQTAQADTGPQATTTEPPATQQVPAGEEAAQSNTAREDSGSRAGDQATKNDFQRLATGVARGGTPTTPASTGKPPPTAVPQAEAARLSQAAVAQHPLQTPGAKALTVLPPNPVASASTPRPATPPGEAGQGKQHSGFQRGPGTGQPQGTTAPNIPTGRTVATSQPEAAHPASSLEAPGAPADADHSGTFVSQRTGGKVKITCSENAKAADAEMVQKYASAVAASADFRCLQQGGVVVARGGAQTVASESGGEVSGTDENSPRSAEGEETRVSQKSYRVSRWREQGFMRG